MAGGLGTGKSGSATATRAGGVVLPNGVTMEEYSGNRFYQFQTGDRTVDFEVSAPSSSGMASVNFYVDRTVKRAQVSTRDGQRENLAIALKVRKVMRAEVASRPDNFKYVTSASTIDGLGDARARLYTRAGFSGPRVAGVTQYAYVRNGRLVPGRAPSS